MSITDSDRILAAGVPIQLAGGEARLRFDFRALKQIEDHYGSLADAATALTTMYNSAFTKLDAAVLSHLEVFLAAGLPSGTVEGDVLELLDVAGGYRTAMVTATAACYDAWTEAFPIPTPSAEGNGPAPADGNGSRGTTSTGSSPDLPDDPTNGSGG